MFDKKEEKAIIYVIHSNTTKTAYLSVDGFIFFWGNEPPFRMTVVGEGLAPPVIYEENYLEASSTATAHATVIPTMGLLPAPIRPIIGAYSESVDKWAFQIQVLAMR